VSEQGFGKRSSVEDYRITNRGGKGVKTLNVTEKVGELVAIKCVTDEDDLMIINKSGITIRLKLSTVSVQGRVTQGVRLINLTKRNDVISNVCIVPTEEDEVETEEGVEPVQDAVVEQETTETEVPNLFSEVEGEE
jgi:DNA gyrase subunit A